MSRMPLLRKTALSLLLPAALLLAPTAFAADDARVDELMRVMNMREQSDTMLRAIDEGMARQFEQMAAQRELTAEQRAKARQYFQAFSDGMREVMRWEAIEPEYRRIYAELFTDAEVDAMIAFYSSPEGASVLAKLPEAMRLGMAAGERRAREVMPELQQKLQADLQSL